MISRRTLIVTALIYITMQSIFAQTDTTYLSKVFGLRRPYRIFLPSDYYLSSKNYPVIYYFHGNTGNHKLDIDGVDKLVRKHEVILVAWYGRSEDSDLRPYNIGNHSNIKYQVQFKDYFTELVAHIDSIYRTIPDRAHRAVIGHSMGGFMSFYLAGKYPDLIGTAFSSKGSPEFFVGYPSCHTLYQMRYMFSNLCGVRTGFATSSQCELYYLNNEVIAGARQEADLDFTLKTYEGPHDISPLQFRDAFEFVVASFANPVKPPVRWNHADLYPGFEIWGYRVDRTEGQPGYVDMRNVTRQGMQLSAVKWEPDGVIIPNVKIDVRTPPVYLSKASYSLLDYNVTKDSIKISRITSDSEGRIRFSVSGEKHQIGIYRRKDLPEIICADYIVDGKGKFLDHGKENSVRLRLLNRGGGMVKNLTVRMESSTPGVTILNPVIKTSGPASGELKWLPYDFRVIASTPPPKDGSPFRIKFRLTFSDAGHTVWKDEFSAPFYFDVPEFTDTGIDDGDSEIFGSGNGNNIAEPGETIMIYEISNGSHRLRLYYDDPYVDSERLYDEIQPDKWGDGYTLSSLIHISEKCPAGHKIKFLASYEVKNWRLIRRDVTWGTFTITVGGVN
jgi:pimeloyl-ACP methyl ester carboxylesterase